MTVAVSPALGYGHASDLAAERAIMSEPIKVFWQPH